MPRYTYCSHIEMKFDELTLHNQKGFSIATVHAVKCDVEYEITPDGDLEYDVKNIEVRQYGPLGSSPHRAYGDAGYLERPIYDELTSQEWRDHIRDKCREDADEDEEAPSEARYPTPESEYVLT